MVHVIASLASLLIALGALAVILHTLSESADKIRLALRITVATPPKIEARPVSIRATVRPLPAALPARQICAA
ncbi:hypothetical protein [Sphingomonas sp. PR090111-T3T-6A]|uniref:hypothetical protein n=1 Tax=Sphingomonas sp. PR090111-T3T-6A TaxID=685778 RepID=UPI0004761ADC|nr:hypothetical protein [Sphingomonas sp. PR090111-T3T-6A]